MRDALSVLHQSIDSKEREGWDAFVAEHKGCRQERTGGEHGTHEKIGIFFESQLPQVLKDNLSKLNNGDDITFRLGQLNFKGPERHEYP